MRTLVISILLLVGLLQTSTRVAIDLTKVGPQIGQRVPDFSLQDQAGKTWTRQSIMEPKGAMLVFFRSADW
jgi:hypothetical protein